MFWRLVRDGNGLQFLFLFLPRWVETEKHKDIFCTFRNCDSRPSGFSEPYFHSCVLRVWPDPAAAHPPMAEGWLKAICPPFRANPDICWLTWRCQTGQHYSTATWKRKTTEKSPNSFHCYEKSWEIQPGPTMNILFSTGEHISNKGLVKEKQTCGSFSIPDPCSTEPAGQAAWRTFPERASFPQASRHSVGPSSSAPCP